jgi:hypothetical protein
LESKLLLGITVWFGLLMVGVLLRAWLSSGSEKNALPDQASSS